MAEYLLVDGHSVIFAWPELRACTSGAWVPRARRSCER